MEIHYEQHYKGYVSSLNKLTNNIGFDSETLKSIMLKNYQNDNLLFHFAAQSWNHTFLGKCLNPQKTKCSNELEVVLTKQFGSGWVWVVKEASGEIKIVGKGNAHNPLTEGSTPLLVCDVWEHAYYLDYLNERKIYINHFWEIINWDFFERNLTNELAFLELNA